MTLGFGEIIRVFMNNLDHPVNITNGPKGIDRIDGIHLFGLNFGKKLDLFGFSWPRSRSTTTCSWRWCCWSWWCRTGSSSRIGRAWMAIRETRSPPRPWASTPAT